MKRELIKFKEFLQGQNSDLNQMYNEAYQNDKLKDYERECLLNLYSSTRAANESTCDEIDAVIKRMEG